MKIIDRYVATRFLLNFVLLGAALYVFGVSVDVVIQASRFVDAADTAVAAGRYSSRVIAFMMMVLDFHGPRIFQFFQFMLGFVSIGAMGFSVAQMHRNRELTALMASGVKLRRLAYVLVLTAGLLQGLQFVNQEFILPNLAARLVRDHSGLKYDTGSQFPIPLTRDGRGTLIQASSFDPALITATGLVAIERDEKGNALRRISASSATWNAPDKKWILTGGLAIEPLKPGDTTNQKAAFTTPVDELQSDLGPELILSRRYRLYGPMLSTSQVFELMSRGGDNQNQAVRLLLVRFMGPFANLLVLAATIPFFLRREPCNMLVQSVRAAAFSIPTMIGVAIMLLVPTDGLSISIAAAIPFALLLPLAAYRLTELRS
ncbi:MAG: LptF/LptG family permease [Phycisphaerales bacterium]|nr:LptF/LptG family permease [Phycisphaerales bacterium]